MEELFVLLAAWLLLGPVIALVLAARAFGKVRALERRLAELEGGAVAPAAGAATERTQPATRPRPSAPQPAPRPEQAAPTHEPPAASKPEPPPVERRPPEAAAPREARAPATARTAAKPAARRTSLEERLGAHLPVWIGGVALALSGAFLVKYSIDQGWLGPTVRVALGLVFGVALLGTGEWMRSRSGRISQALSAAGVFVLFASLWAAVSLYGLIGPLLGFGLLALTTAAAVALSLRQGPFVALLGLVGGFLSPVLAGSRELPSGLLFGYLLLLQVGLLVLTRKRRWWPLALLTLVASLGWAAAWLVFELPTRHGPWIGLFLVGSAAATVVAAGLPGAREDWGRRGQLSLAPPLAWVGTGLALVLTAALVGAGGFEVRDWVFLGLLCAGCVVLAAIDPTYHALPWISATLGALLLLAWHVRVEPLPTVLFAGVTVGLGAVHAVGARLAVQRSRPATAWAALSVSATIGYFTIAYFALRDPWHRAPWGAISLALAVAHLASLVPLLRRRDRVRGGDATLAALAAGVTALVTLAVPLELQREWITVAWALEVVALALINGRLRVRGLRVLAGVLAAGVLVRLLLNPYVLRYPIGELPVLDWLLYGYGIPVAAFVGAAVIFRKHRDDVLVTALECGAIALAAAWIWLENRHLFVGDRLGRASMGLAELGTWTSAWLLLGAGLLAASSRWPRASLRWGGAVVAFAGLGTFVLGPFLASNPLWRHVAVGETPVVNLLLLSHALPTVLAAGLGELLGRSGWKGAGMPFRAAAVVGLFLFVTLEVRQWFHGAFLDRGATTNAEWHAYSVAWIVLGTLLLVAGIRARSSLLRHAALAVMLVAVVKVFLFDMRHLRDLYRVLSFLGLGVSLLLLGWLYQRFVFRRDDTEPADEG